MQLASNKASKHAYPMRMRVLSLAFRRPHQEARCRKEGHHLTSEAHDVDAHWARTQRHRQTLKDGSKGSELVQVRPAEFALV